jgi:hypothetical protein
MIIAYRAIPAIYEVLQPIATRSGGETYDGGELPGIVITGGGGGGGGGGGYGGGGGSGGSGGGNYEGGSNPPTVTLSANGTITLMDSYNLVLTVSSGTVSDAIFIIGKSSGLQYTLQRGTSITCNEKSKKPGKWQIKAIVTLSSGASINSNTVEVTVQYPDVSTIKKNSTVSTKMSTVWTQTKNAASASGVMEKGFAIFANTATMTYECGTTINGTSLSACYTEGSIYISGNESASSSPIVGGKYLVADFHAHPPLTYCNDNAKFRPVGPSAEDISVANSSNTPGLVYDYTGAYIIFPEFIGIGIRGGHDSEGNAKIYSCGPNRKPTPD